MSAKGLAVTPDPRISTVYEGFQNTIQYWGERPFLGTRKRNHDGSSGPYRWKTYSQVNEISKRVAAGLKQLVSSKSFEGKSYNTLGIWSRNREELYILDLACERQNITVVPLYETLDDDAVLQALEQTQLEVIAIGAEATGKIEPLVDRMQFLKHILLLDDEIANSFLTNIENNNITYSYFSNLANTQPVEDNPPTSDSVLALAYTAGTTGTPKGVEITHRMLLASVCNYAFSSNMSMKPSDVYLAYLPFANVNERIIGTQCKLAGARVGFFTGDPANLIDDSQALQPSVFSSLPRLYNRIQTAFTTAIQKESPFARSLVRYGTSQKLHDLRKHGSYTNKLFDWLVFDKVREILGGNLRVMYTHGGPISPDVQKFMSIAFSCPVLNVYSATEGQACITHPGEIPTGHVGAPGVATELKVVEVPELNLSVQDVVRARRRIRGEVLIRGPSVMSSYVDRNQRGLDEEGWLRTGDIGEILENGRLRIIDKRSNIFKLQGGEYISPQPLENLYTASLCISQMFIYGDENKRFPVALVVPDKDYVQSMYPSENFEDLVTSGKLNSIIADEMSHVAASANLTGSEKITKFRCITNPFTIENGAMTPTLSIRRSAISSMYRNDIEAFYS